MFLKVIPVAAAAALSMSAFAVEKEITVTAQIDPAIELLSPAGDALPSDLPMQYVPGKGLIVEKFDAKIFSNDNKNDIQIRLQTEPKLTHTTDPAATPIDLTVSVDGAALTTTGTTLKAADLFTGADVNSRSLTFSIAQKKPDAVATPGLYRGPVRLIVTTAAATAP
ncbi:CS1 type fimbrial major subunit [Burkholderia sp. AU45388]|uniref:CS1 type fimbrial major subunit n=1 Tax=Burkholderia sp. AU45388 TaxID=3059206 RepID=UPI00264FFAD3|nr:CS1 type fimbrial major subunit [Burkholderia sp. AU45388]MDN7429214.1 CS1 type fimbrial major subunit [Burkholderia sp. AU45388]